MCVFVFFIFVNFTFIGFLFQNGATRRTKGGVFIMLLKEDESIPKGIIDEIFEEEKQRKSEKMKQRRRAIAK